MVVTEITTTPISLGRGALSAWWLVSRATALDVAAAAASVSLASMRRVWHMNSLIELVAAATPVTKAETLALDSATVKISAIITSFCGV
jgi:hypothetical protein